MADDAVSLGHGLDGVSGLGGLAMVPGIRVVGSNLVKGSVHEGRFLGIFGGRLPPMRTPSGLV